MSTAGGGELFSSICLLGLLAAESRDHGSFLGVAVDWEDVCTALCEVDVCVGDGSYYAG